MSVVLRLFRPAFFLLVIACVWRLPAIAQTKSTSKQTGGVSFRAPTVAMNNVVLPDQLMAQHQVQNDYEDLEEKQEALEGEIRYARAKMDAAQKQMAVQSVAGNPEQADRLNSEVKDWEARLRVSKEQLALVQEELSRSKPSGAVTIGDPDIVLPGENLELFVNEDPSFNGRYQVRRGGYIILPQVGRIPVAGKSISESEAAVRRALEDSQLHRATVLIERIAGSDVETGPLIYLSGEFRNPRPYRIPPGTAPTLVSVILSSGGVSDKADLSRVKVMRMSGGKGVVEEVNVQKILDGGGLTSDVTLAEGDVITISAGPANLVYVTGNVKRQGSYHLVPGERLTAYGAILQAGGFARFADLKKVHTLRTMPDGTKKKIPVNVVEVQKGLRPDVILQSNDIVVVPEKWFSF